MFHGAVDLKKITRIILGKARYLLGNYEISLSIRAEGEREAINKEQITLRNEAVANPERFPYSNYD